LDNAQNGVWRVLIVETTFPDWCIPVLRLGYSAHDTGHALIFALAIKNGLQFRRDFVLIVFEISLGSSCSR
jgi:hypothetical protein